jgi:GNAT superfamily N-acetyltransferase
MSALPFKADDTLTVSSGADVPKATMVSPITMEGIWKRLATDAAPSRKIAADYGQAIFELMNEAYSPLYGYSPLSQRQIDQYVKMYLPIVDLRMVTLITDAEDKLIAVGISMPSLSEALQKSHGRLLPLGWYYLLKALFMKRRAKMLDLLLVAVKPEYQNKGVNALLFSDLIPVYQKLGFIFAESNPELEMNGKVQAQWEYFKTEQHKRRRAFTKKID